MTEMKQLDIESAIGKVDFTDCIYSLYDRKSNTYGGPFLAATDDDAKRMVYDMVNYGGDNLVVRHIEDFSLFKLAEFNKRTGSVLSLIRPEFVVDANVFKSTPQINAVN